MATNESHIMTSHNLLNYSGMLFNSGNGKVPFSTLIGGKSRITHSFKFPTSLSYSTTGGSSQPAITETASLTAPTPEFVKRTQNPNCVQIFQRALTISYSKLASMDQLSGLNIAGASANPASEIDWQVAQAMEGIAKDIEYSFINGTYQDGTYDDVAYKTGGIINAISTNTVAAGSAPLTFWHVADAIKKIAAGYGDTEGLVLLLNPVQVMQLNADAVANGLTVVNAGRNVNGLNVNTIVTPFGEVGILPDSYVPAGTAVVVNPKVCAPVYMPVPGKGNFFLEQLAKTGAGDKYQIYGHAGLDYGAEFCHAKITGLTTTFTAPNYVSKVAVVSSSTEPVFTKAVT